MRKTLQSIITKTDLQEINRFVSEWNNCEAGDEEIQLLKDIILSIKDLDIVTQFVVYTFLTKGDKSMKQTAKLFGVSSQCVAIYLSKWKEYVQKKFGNRYVAYKDWLNSFV